MNNKEKENEELNGGKTNGEKACIFGCKGIAYHNGKYYFIGNKKTEKDGLISCVLFYFEVALDDIRNCLKGNGLSEDEIRKIEDELNRQDEDLINIPQVSIVCLRDETLKED